MKNLLKDNRGISKNTTVILILSLVLLFAAGYFLYSNFQASNKENNIIKIATKPMTEQFILGEMLNILIEEKTDLEVELTKGIGGGTANIMPAMESGEFDLYPEYTGTGWLYVLKKTDIPSDEILLQEMKALYGENYNMSWVGMYGFNNTYGLCVQNTIATEKNINTYSDLAKISPELVFGAEYDFFEREDGYKALVDAYGFGFKDTVDLDIGLKYEALRGKQIDAMNIFTTDGQLAISDVKVLEDDLGLYENYYCGTVVRNEVLENHPELEEVLLLMEGLISDSEMQDMNYKVESGQGDEATVAREYLVSKGLI